MLKTSRQISQEMAAKLKAAKTKEEREAVAYENMPEGMVLLIEAAAEAAKVEDLEALAEFAQIACGTLELLARKCAVSSELMDETIAVVGGYVRGRGRKLRN